MSEKLLKLFGILLAPSAQPFSVSVLDVPLTSADKDFRRAYKRGHISGGAYNRTKKERF